MNKDRPTFLAKVGRFMFGREPEATTIVAPATLAHPGGELRVGDVLLDEYEVLGILGQGGMGKVYLVVQGKSTGYHYAVKRTRLADDHTRRMFLAELQTWMDLPEHPHLTACRFFRSLGFEQVIFAEYVEGGSLKEWIHQGKLTRLEQILDVAIQLAWGLHALHEMGVIHQDVKPGNALMTPDGTVKITDFGLARARASGEKRLSPDPNQSSLISFGGMTPTYCSPEQAEQQPLSHKTDIWSWGVSVLQMFTGRVTWASGPEAGQALEDFLTNQPSTPSPQPTTTLSIPAGVADVLRKCFQINPAERWGTMLAAAETLPSVYREVAGTEYPRPRPPFPNRSSPSGKLSDQDVEMAYWEARQWRPGKHVLSEALQADGREPAEADILAPPANEGHSLKARGIADLAAYEEARRIYERLISQGHAELEPALAWLCTYKARLHEFMGDWQGALVLHERAIGLQERLANPNHRPEVPANDCLAEAYRAKAEALMKMGDHRAAVVCYDRASGILERLLTPESQETAVELDRIYAAKAKALLALGEQQALLALYRQTLEHRQRYQLLEAVAPQGWAKAYPAQVNMLMALGDYRAAVALCDRGIGMIEHQLSGKAGTMVSWWPQLYLQKADAMLKLGDPRTALGLYDRGIEIGERALKELSWPEPGTECNLANALLSKGDALASLGDHRPAIILYDRGMAIMERLIKQHGYQQFLPHLAQVYVAKGAAAEVLNDVAEAAAHYDRAIAIWERLIKQEGRLELLGDLAQARTCRAAISLADESERDDWIQLSQVRAILKAEFARTGRRELRGTLWRLDWILPMKRYVGAVFCFAMGAIYPIFSPGSYGASVFWFIGIIILANLSLPTPARPKGRLILAAFCFLAAAIYAAFQCLAWRRHPTALSAFGGVMNVVTLLAILLLAYVGYRLPKTDPSKPAAPGPPDHRKPSRFKKILRTILFKDVWP